MSGELEETLRHHPRVDVRPEIHTWIGLVNHYLVNRDLFAPDGSVVARRDGGALDGRRHDGEDAAWSSR